MKDPFTYWIVSCSACHCSVRYDDFGDMVWKESAGDTRHGGSRCRRAGNVYCHQAETLFTLDEDS